ncbi:hypothetical protein VINE108521_07665 [Vibrio neonatus]
MAPKNLWDHFEVTEILDCVSDETTQQKSDARYSQSRITLPDAPLRIASKPFWKSSILKL